MGTVFKPIVTKPLPRGAQVVEQNGARVGQWRNAHGKACTAPVRTTPRGDCIAVESGRYLARYRDGNGIVRTVATGLRDLMAARAVLAQLERRAEMVRSGVLTTAEDATAEHKRTQIGEHVEAYLAALHARRRTPHHIRSVRRQVTVIIDACGFKTLADIRRELVERWLTESARAGRAPLTTNAYLHSFKWFCNWCVDTERLVASPVARVGSLETKGDRRRVPRAFTPDELARILDAAQRRPLTEARLFNRGWRRGQNGARLRPETVAKLELLGLERATAYKALLLTGLRLGELASIRVADVVLDGVMPHIVLDARNEKNRKGSSLPLREDLVDDLRRWLAQRPSLPDSPLFRLTANQVKVFDRDLRFAGIAKRDDRGRTACVHSLRHTFATLLSAGGVSPRVAQAAMRHSDISLTMTTYTDPRLLDVAGALAVLPALTIQPATQATATGS